MIWQLMLIATVTLVFTMISLADTPDHRPAWELEADARIEKHRKGDFSLILHDAEGKPISEVDLQVELTRHAFYFGTCINGDPTSQNPSEVRYREIITTYFNTLVAENHMKWYANEKKPGELDYERADAYMEFAREHDLAMRGHCLFWAKEKFVQDWLQQLPADQLRAKVNERLESIVSRYKGQLIAWDVNNEMRNGSFYKDKLGEAIRAEMFKKASAIDPQVPLFVNDYSILGNEKNTEHMINEIKWLQKHGAKVGGIGIQEHGAQRLVIDGRAETGYHEQVEIDHHALTDREMLETLDELGKLGLPIHLTEVSSKTQDVKRRGESLYILGKLSFSHPSVEAFMLWGFWDRRHWMRGDAALVEGPDLELNAAGKRFFHDLLGQWQTKEAVKTNEQGKATFRGFYGTYTITRAGEDKPLGTIVFSKENPEGTLKLKK